jgi:hypothetical protein
MQAGRLRSRHVAARSNEAAVMRSVDQVANAPCTAVELTKEVGLYCSVTGNSGKMGADGKVIPVQPALRFRRAGSARLDWHERNKAPSHS